MRLQGAAKSTAAFTSTEAEVAGIVSVLSGVVLDDVTLLTLPTGRIAGCCRSL